MAANKRLIMCDFRLSVPPNDAVTPSERKSIEDRLSAFLSEKIAEKTKARNRPVFQFMIVERPAATTGVELNCLSHVHDAEHLRALLHGSVVILQDVLGDRFSIRARALEEDGPSIEIRRPDILALKRRTA